MKRTTYTHAPVVPKGYTGQDYNRWMKHITNLVDKITGVKADQRLYSLVHK